MENTVKITYTFPDGAGGTFTDTDQIQIEHLQAEVQQIIDKAVLNQTNSIIKLLDDIVAKWSVIRETPDESHYWLGLVTEALKYQIKGGDATFIKGENK